QVSIRSVVKTPPRVRYSLSISSASSTSVSEPGVLFTWRFISGSSSYRSSSIGLGGSILLMTPSRPAMRQAAKERYGLQDGSGVRNSRRFALGSSKYIGMRTQALRLGFE